MYDYFTKLKNKYFSIVGIIKEYINQYFSKPSLIISKA